jgi:hypothetical protein
MKRLIVVIMALQLAAAAVFGQDIGLQISVASRPLDPGLLAQVGLNRDEIEEVLELQEQFRLVKERTNVELDVIKAQIARLLYLNENEFSEIDRLLEQAGELRLEQEKFLFRTMSQIRTLFGEDRWSELVKRIRTQTRNQIRQETPAGPTVRNEQGSDNGSSSGSSNRR